jgi:hypothetical protein
MRVRRDAAILALVAVALSTTACTGGGPAVEAPEAFSGGVSAIWVQPMRDAQSVRASDGRIHVEYNLLVVNAYSDPVTLTGVTMLGPDGRELGSIRGDALAAATQTLYDHAPSATVPASASVAVEVDLSLLGDGEVPARVANRIAYALPDGVPGNVIVDDTIVDGPRVEVPAARQISISPPLRGEGWLATSACCSPNVHRDLRLVADGLRWATAETFAVDWAQVRGDRLYDGDGSANEQFYGFGAEVVAVADATVVAATDGVPESIPFTAAAPDSKEGFGGNQVILKLADGVYAAYGHLQPGSLTVHVGDRVRTGDVLARLGNSGPSQGPHLHFGILDGPDLFTADSLPFVLRSFGLTGTVDLASASGDTLTIAPESRQLRNAYPLYGTIVDLP